MKRTAYFLAGVFLVTRLSSSPAADKTWTGPASGEWFEPSNWSPPGVPEADNRVFVTGGPVIIRSNIAVSFLLLTGASLQSVERTNTFTFTNFIWAGGTIGGAGTTFIPPDGSLVITGLNQVNLNNHTLLNAGSALWASQAGIFLNTNAVVRNDGTFYAQAIGYMFGSGSSSAFINAGTLLVTNPNVFTTFYAPVTNRGTMLLKGASLRGLYGFTQTGGRISMENGRLDADGGVRVFGGTLSGDGMINGPYFLNRGDLLPGRPLGTLHIAGNFTNTGNLYVDSQSAPGPAMNDLLQVSGHARLGGSLHICYSGFLPPVPGLSFTILSASSKSGSFARIDGLDLGGGSVLIRAEGPGSFTLLTDNGGPRREGWMTIVDCGEGRYQVRFTGDPSTSYLIQGATELGDWTTLLSTNSTSGVNYFLDTNAPSFPRRFYRVKKAP
jgi:hypothetical protein